MYSMTLKERLSCEIFWRCVQCDVGRTNSVAMFTSSFVCTETKLYHGESWELMIRRWFKLMKDFGLKNKQYDISKIPDIYDFIRYDLQHNMKTLRFTEAEELHAYAKAMADIVIPLVRCYSSLRQRSCMPTPRPWPTSSFLW